MTNGKENQGEGKSTNAIVFGKDEMLQHPCVKDAGMEEPDAPAGKGLSPVPTMRQVKKSCSGAGLLPLVAAAYFIISGSLRIHESTAGTFLKTWGDIMLGAGSILLLCKIIAIARK